VLLTHAGYERKAWNENGTLWAETAPREAAPHEMAAFLSRRTWPSASGIGVPVLGSSAQVSDLVNGKRGISKAQIRKLAEFFKVSPELFL
jgi:HTH-type transcriptional regulator / antitoxin HigA